MTPKMRKAIIHEYGHAILHRQDRWLETDEGEAMSEGFCDFLAASYFSAVSSGFRDTIVGDWEWVHSTTRGRAVNSDKHYPEDMIRNRHKDGMIWSAALWELFEVLGRDAAIRLVIQSHYLLSLDAGFFDGAMALLHTDRELNNGANVDLILGIMERRGILSPPELAPDTFENNDTVEAATEIQLPSIAENLSITSGDNDYYQFELKTPKKVSLTIDFNPFYGQLHLALMMYDGKAIVTRGLPRTPLWSNCKQVIICSKSPALMGQPTIMGLKSLLTCTEMIRRPPRRYTLARPLRVSSTSLGMRMCFSLRRSRVMWSG